MITFYEGSGSKEIDLLGQVFVADQWARLKNVAIGLLERRGQMAAADLLRAHPFVLHSGTNSFGDEFQLLYMKASLDSYVSLAELAAQPDVRANFRMVAKAVGEVGHSVRFIAVELDSDGGPEAVASPVLEVSSDVVERALRDAERLLATQGATSGVDRVHTAFHGYLRALLDKCSISYPTGASITELFKILREQHPTFRSTGPRHSDIDRILKALATVVDALNLIRNQASVAHPNEALLAEPEAMLVVNGVRSLLHYLNSKTR